MNATQGSVGVIGGGFVGLNLVAHLLEKQKQFVTLIEKNSAVVELMKSGKYLVWEPGLAQILDKAQSDGRLVISTTLNGLDCKTYFVCIGTPKPTGSNSTSNVMIEALTEVFKLIPNQSKIFLRSTVAIGTTNVLKKLATDLGRSDISLFFAPERTAEGVALAELKVLPQVLGAAEGDSLTDGERELASLGFKVVSSNSAEVAELAKLACNTWRDVIFAYSNELAIMGEVCGISALEAINLANHNYHRANIPLPGPVGGPCLSKDAYILLEAGQGKIYDSVIRAGRSINDSIAPILISAIENSIKDRVDPIVCIAGLAFKGKPKTNDIRDSLGIQVLDKVKASHSNWELKIWDENISQSELNFSIPKCEDDSDFKKVDVLVIANNAEFFSSPSGEKKLQALNKTTVIFDLWGVTKNLNGISAEINIFGDGNWVKYLGK
jgi:UDP-N-acetyl-D-mannosaminuronic acid dehydrogenase